MLESQQIPLDCLLEAEWNANRVPPKLLAKIRRSIERFGVVENLVARPHPTQRGCCEVLSGNHRLRIMRELGHATAPVVLVDLDDASARLLAQTLNRTRGTDNPQAYARVLEEVLATFGMAEVVEVLPESEATIDRVLREFGGGDAEAAEFVPAAPAVPRSRPGEIYKLGPHRLACGDATDPTLVAALLAGERPVLLATDPPYGIRLDHGWRDVVTAAVGVGARGRDR